MNRLTQLLAVLALVLQGPSFWAQDPSFLQYDLLPMYINPATAGLDSGMRWTNMHFNQWPAMSGNFVTQTSALDCGTADGKLGLGLMVMTDQAAQTLFTSSFSVMPSYGINLTEEHQLRVGATLGYFQKSLDWSNLTFGDMIDPRRGFVYETSDIPRGGTVAFVSTGIGMAYSGSRFDAGVSAVHINEPNESLVVGVSRLPMRLNAHAQYTLPFFQTVVTSNDEEAPQAEQGEGDAKSDSTVAKQEVKIQNGDVSFHALYNRQGEFQHAVVGVRRQMKNGFRLGVMAWGFPGSVNQFAPTVGMAWQRIQVDYGYGVTTSDLTPATGGSHSVTLSVAFGKAYQGDRKMRKARGNDVEPQISEEQPAEE